jgi:hypothetical protein
MKAIKSEMNGCGDVLKLIACINVILHIVSQSGSVRFHAFKSLLTLLGHKYPRIRKFASEHIYIFLISDGDLVGAAFSENDPLDRKCAFARTQEDYDQVTSLLIETVWDCPIGQAREKRTKLCELMEIDLNVKAKANSNSETTKVVDELDSYEALVREAGY